MFEGRPILDLSASGLSYDLLASQADTRVGDMRSGTLRVGADALTISARVTRVDGMVAGAHFAGAPIDVAKLRARIREALAVEIAAAHLTRVSTDKVQPEADGVPSWYCGTDQDEIHLVESPGGEIVRFAISLFGNYLEGGARVAPRFGRIDPATAKRELPDGARYKRSAIVRWESRIPDDEREAILRFVDAVSALPESQRAALRSLVAAP